MLTPEPGCRIETRDALALDDPGAAGELLCEATRGLRSTLRPGGSVVVRLGRFAGRVVVWVRVEDGRAARLAERKIMVDGEAELPTAVERLSDSLRDGSTVEATRDVTNVVGGDRKPRKSLTSNVHGWAMVAGGVGLTRDAVVGAGIDLGLAFGGDQWQFGGGLRALAGSKDAIGDDLLMSHVVLYSGVRWLASKQDLAPVVEGGLSVGVIRPGVDEDVDSPATFGAYVLGGVEVLRTHQLGGIVGVRLDLPVSGHEYSTYDGPTYDSRVRTAHTQWAPILGFSAGLRF